MIVACPQCGAGHSAPALSRPGSGATITCLRCGHVFAGPEGQPPDLEAELLRTDRLSEAPQIPNGVHPIPEASGRSERPGDPFAFPDSGIDAALADDPMVRPASDQTFSPEPAQPDPSRLALYDDPASLEPTLTGEPIADLFGWAKLETPEADRAVERQQSSAAQLADLGRPSVERPGPSGGPSVERLGPSGGPSVERLAPSGGPSVERLALSGGPSVERLGSQAPALARDSASSGGSTRSLGLAYWTVGLGLAVAGILGGLALAKGGWSSVEDPIAPIAESGIEDSPKGVPSSLSSGREEKVPSTPAVALTDPFPDPPAAPGYAYLARSTRLRERIGGRVGARLKTGSHVRRLVAHEGWVLVLAGPGGPAGFVEADMLQERKPVSLLANAVAFEGCAVASSCRSRARDQRAGCFERCEGLEGVRFERCEAACKLAFERCQRACRRRVD